jgi:hypothetical protein
MIDVLSTEVLNLLADKLSYAMLFVVLFWWTLRSNEKREQRYLSLLDLYGKQLESIAATLLRIQEQMNGPSER